MERKGRNGTNWGNLAFVKAFDHVDLVEAIVSKELEESMTVSPNSGNEVYTDLVNPVDGSANLRVNCAVGSIFLLRNLRNSIEESIRRKGSLSWGKPV